METKISAEFFEEFELTGKCMEFCIDKTRFLKIVNLGTSKAMVDMIYDEETRRMTWHLFAESGHVTKFECVYYRHDYGEGYVVNERDFTNHIIMGFAEFEHLLSCFAEWECGTFGVYCKRAHESWKMVFVYSGSDAVKGSCTYWGRIGRSSVLAMEENNFFLPKVHDLSHQDYDLKKMRTVFKKLKMSGNSLVSICLGVDEPLELVFHVGLGVRVTIFVAPQSIEKN